MSHQQPHSYGRPAARGPPRGYQQQQQSQYAAYPQNAYYGGGYQQQPSNRAYNYPYGYPQQYYGGYQQPRGYTGPAGYQRNVQQKQPPAVSANAKPFVPRKKKMLQIQRPDGTDVISKDKDKDAPASTANSDAAAAPPEPPVTTEAAVQVKTTAASEPAAEATDLTVAKAKEVAGPTVAEGDEVAAKPTPEPAAATNAEASVDSVTPIEAEPVEKVQPTEVVAEVEVTEPPKPSPLLMPAQPADEKTSKEPLASLQTNDLDDWDDATIETPGAIKAPHIPRNMIYSIDMLKNIRETCNLDPLESWPAIEITKAMSTPRGRESPRGGGPRQRRSYQDAPRHHHDQRRGVPAARQWVRGKQPNPRQQQQRDMPRQQIKLHTTKNSWSRDKHEMAKAKDNLESVKTAANSMLNKISVDNFDRLLPKFLELEIQTKRQFEAITEIIFDKALRMPTYCHLYARLCGEVNKEAKMFCDKIVKIVEEEEDGQKVYYYDVGADDRTDGVEGPYAKSDEALAKGTKVCTFKRLLLNQCQRVFESHSSWEEAFQKAQDPSLSAAAKKKALDDAEETRFKVKSRSLGIVQFVAHLFLNSLLSEKRVHVCMSELLQRCDKELNQTPPVTEGVEVFTKIITEVGERIDNGPNRAIIDLYMQNLKEIIKTKGLDSRTKFIIMDVIDLRDRYKWVPRRAKAKQVTKAQFKREADAKMRSSQQRRGGSHNRRHNDRRGGGGGRGRGGGGGYRR